MSGSWGGIYLLALFLGYIYPTERNPALPHEPPILVLLVLYYVYGLVFCYLKSNLSLLTVIINYRHVL